MKPLNADDNDLTALEQDYWARFIALFARVDAKKPEKGIQALFARARQQALQQAKPLEVALQAEFEAATERTERRVSLLSQCQIPQARDTLQERL